MKTIFICEGGCTDVKVEPYDGDDSLISVSQGDHNIVTFDAAQRDELIKALGQMTVPGEELQEDDDDDD